MYDFLKTQKLEECTSPVERLVNFVKANLYFVNVNKKLIQFISTETKYLQKDYLKDVLAMEKDSTIGYYHELLVEINKEIPINADLGILASVLAYLVAFLPMKGWTVNEESLDDVNSCILDLVFKGLDYIRNQIGNLENGAAEEDKQINTDSLTESIRSNIAKMKNNVKTFVENKKSILKDKPVGSKSVMHEAAEKLNKAQQNIEIPKVVQDGAQKSDDSHLKKYKATIFFDDYCNMISVRAFMVASTLSGVFKGVTYFPDNLTNDENIIRYLTDNGLEVNFSTEFSYYQIKDIIEDISE
jgi:hypothetical protein